MLCKYNIDDEVIYRDDDDHFFPTYILKIDEALNYIVNDIYGNRVSVREEQLIDQKEMCFTGIKFGDYNTLIITNGKHKGELCHIVSVHWFMQNNGGYYSVLLKNSGHFIDLLESEIEDYVKYLENVPEIF